MPDAVVVGAGPNGLAAAIAIARSGRTVTVYEANHDIGGGCRSAELTRPGFVHDVCSAFHPMAAASPFFRQLPLSARGLEWIQPDAPLAHPLDDGSAAILERSVEATAKGLGADRGGWSRLFAPLARGCERLFDEALRPLVHLPHDPLLLARFGVVAMLPARAVADRFRDEPARALFAGMAAHSFLPLERPFSAAFALILGAAGQAVGWPIARAGDGRPSVGGRVSLRHVPRGARAHRG